MRRKPVEFDDCFSSPPREGSQAMAQGWGAQAKPSGLTELRRQNWESGKVRVATVHRAEARKGENCSSRELVICTGLPLRADQLMHMRKLSQPGEQTT